MIHTLAIGCWVGDGRRADLQREALEPLSRVAGAWASVIFWSEPGDDLSTWLKAQDVAGSRVRGRGKIDGCMGIEGAAPAVRCPFDNDQLRGRAYLGSKRARDVWP